jgi:hypothetical protein
MHVCGDFCFLLREQKPSHAPKRHRKQMRSHPLFKDVLRAYALCKRPVLGAIPPLEASEEVLFKEFAEEDHALLKDTEVPPANVGRSVRP